VCATETGSNFLNSRSQINVLVANKRWISILWHLAVSTISICFVVVLFTLNTGRPGIRELRTFLYKEEFNYVLLIMLLLSYLHVVHLFVCAIDDQIRLSELQKPTQKCCQICEKCLSPLAYLATMVFDPQYCVCYAGKSHFML